MAQQGSTQQTIGYVFLGLMVVFLIIAIGEFGGDATWILILSAIVFLIVGLSLMAGPTWGGGGGGSGQQQSVVLGGGRVLTQSSGAGGMGGMGGVLTMCRSCNARIPETARFCPDCGNALGA